jgi:hypothetical protein
MYVRSSTCKKRKDNRMEEFDLSEFLTAKDVEDDCADIDLNIFDN